MSWVSYDYKGSFYFGDGTAEKNGALSISIYLSIYFFLGDFAILINSGLSVKKALLFNFLSALTCYMGMALGILLGEIDWACYIFAFAAGIFLYVALGDMVRKYLFFLHIYKNLESV